MLETLIATLIALLTTATAEAVQAAQIKNVPTSVQHQTLIPARTQRSNESRTTNSTQKETTTKTTNASLETSPKASNNSQLESLVLKYSNEARAKNGVKPLSADAALINLARAHSEDMLENNYFSHKDQSGCNSTCRMNGSGYAWTKMGENIHQMSGYKLSLDETAKKIVNDWMNSPSHRANLLDPVFTKAGVGIAIEGTTIYSTTEYALPR